MKIQYRGIQDFCVQLFHESFLWARKCSRCWGWNSGQSILAYHMECPPGNVIFLPYNCKHSSPLPRHHFSNTCLGTLFTASFRSADLPPVFFVNHCCLVSTVFFRILGCFSLPICLSQSLHAPQSQNTYLVHVLHPEQWTSGGLVKHTLLGPILSFS